MSPATDSCDATNGYDDPKSWAIPKDFTWDARKPRHEVLSLSARPEWVTGNYGAFPLYPWSLRWVGGRFRVAGLNPIFANLCAGILISLLGNLGALFALASLGRSLFDERTGALAAFYLLIFPSAVCPAAVYTEGLFLGLSFGAVALIQARKPGWG